MLDDALLDDPAALARADADSALLALAGAGARIRNALRLAQEGGLDRLQPDGRPRTVLVAGHGSALAAGEFLAALCGAACLVLPLRPDHAAPGDTGRRATADPLFTQRMGWYLPGWTGPLDLLVVASADGSEPGLPTLLQQAYARGCSTAVIAPRGSRLFEAAAQVRALPLPYAAGPPVPAARPSSPWDETLGRPAAPAAESDLPPEDPAALWAFLAPLLALAGKIGIVAVDTRSLQAAADRLDEAAVRCRPDAEAYLNPAKTLAGRLAGSLPLLWGDGPLTAAAAHRFAALLADRAGQPALTGRLPEALPAQRGLFADRLGSAAGPDDIFRDRVAEPDPLRIRLMLLRRTAPEGFGGRLPAPGQEGAPGREGWRAPEQQPQGRERAAEAESSEAVAVRRTLDRVRRLAEAHDIALSEITTDRTDPVESLAELVGVTDFAAVYLGLAAVQAGDRG
jgi:hypothetical protein